MKICVVEDYEGRVEAFQMLLHPHDLTICRTAKEGTDAVEVEKFDVIFLDHDLGEGEDDNGFWVAKAVARGVNKETPVVIHSMNPVGAENIFHQLRYNPKVKLPFSAIRLDILDTKPWIR